MARDSVPASSDSLKAWSFEPTGRLVHLRWAIAELGIGIDIPSAGLDAAERALGIFSNRALTLVQSLDGESDSLADAIYAAEVNIADVQSSLSQAYSLRQDRARALHASRRKLHQSLVTVAEALAREGGMRRSATSGFDAPELGSLLALRQMFSAFRGGMITAGEQRSRLSWALEVAASELSVLMALPVLNDLPAASRSLIEDLFQRVTAWSSKPPEPLLGRSLYREASRIPELASELSGHVLLLEHDARTLAELSAVLGNERSGDLLEIKVLGLMCALRGLDAELDRLELNLIYGAAGVLGTLSLRVADLRSRFSRGSRVTAAS
jgi:hypothetical protein